MTEVYTLVAESGDEYKLQFTTERSNLIADDILDQLKQKGIEVVEIGLGRVQGTSTAPNISICNAKRDRLT